MSQKPFVGILTKVGIVLLGFALYYVIYKQYEISEIEKQVLNDSRLKLSILKEAEAYFNRKTRRYTENFEEILTYIQADSVLKNREKRVKLTNKLASTVDTYVSNNVTVSLRKIKDSSHTIKIILDEIRDEYQSTPDVVLAADELYNKLEGSLISNELVNFNIAAANLDTLFQVRIDISEHILQNAVEKILTKSEFVVEHIGLIEIGALKNFWEIIEKDLEKITKLLNRPNMIIEVKSARYNKQAGIVSENIAKLRSYNLENEKAEVVTFHSKLVSLKSEFIEASNFALTLKAGKPALEEAESLLLQLNEDTQFAPPLKDKKFIFELTVEGYKISCPNKKGEISHGIFNQKYRNYGYVTNLEKSWK
jgi:hypothetical protein